MLCEASRLGPASKLVRFPLYRQRSTQTVRRRTNPRIKPVVLQPCRVQLLQGVLELSIRFDGGVGCIRHKGKVRGAVTDAIDASRRHQVDVRIVPSLEQNTTLAVIPPHQRFGGCLVDAIGDALVVACVVEEEVRALAVRERRPFHVVFHAILVDAVNRHRVRNVGCVIIADLPDGGARYTAAREGASVFVKKEVLVIVLVQQASLVQIEARTW